MKKLTVLSVVGSIMVLFLLGSVTQATALKSNKLDINLTVSQWAMIVCDTNSLDVTVQSLNASTAKYSNEAQLQVQSNGRVLVSITQDWKALAEQLGIEETALVGTNDQAIIWSQINMLPQWPSHPGYWMGSFSSGFSAQQGGVWPFKLRIAAKIQSANPDWTKLSPGTHSGKLIVTVSSY